MKLRFGCGDNVAVRVPTEPRIEEPPPYGQPWPTWGGGSMLRVISIRDGVAYLEELRTGIRGWVDVLDLDPWN